MPRMPSVDDTYLVLEYDRMTREMAAPITPLPIQFMVDRQLMSSLNGMGINGARLYRLTKWSQLTTDPSQIVSFRLVMSEWLFSIFKNDKVTMRKFIGHELAHIRFLTHDEGFKEFAALLGAGELSNGSEFKMVLRTGNRWIHRLAPLIELLPFRTKTALLLRLGVKFEIAGGSG